MGDIGGLLGLGGGASGSGFASPTGAHLVDPTTSGQLTDAYGNVQNSMQSQQALLAALQAQNGLQNQSQVYNQMQGVVNGTGPNPAQAMLAQSTGANVANQAALMAGQRGANANVGLVGRQIGQQGAATQQQAAGQAATMQAQQSLNALTGAGGMANTQAGNQIGQTNANTQAQQANQQALLNARAAYNTAQVGSQSNVNTANAGLAQTQMQGQQGMIGGIMSAAGSAAPLLLAAGGGEISSQQEIPYAPNSGPQSKFGQYLKTKDTQTQDSNNQNQMGASSEGGKALNKGFSDLGKGIAKGMSSPSDTISMTPNPMVGESGAAGGGNLAGGPLDVGGGFGVESGAAMGAGDAMGIGSVTAGAVPVAAEAAPVAMMAAARGGQVNDYRTGGNVNAANPSQKAVKPGNSYANDKVPAMLSAGEVVIPRDVMQSKDPVGASAKFVQAVLAKRGMRK